MKDHHRLSWTFYVSLLILSRHVYSAFESGVIWFIVGCLCMAIGALMNMLAIYFNDKKMPVKSDIQETDTHCPVNQRTRFLFLCDNIKFNFKIISGWASIGDVFAVIGGAMMIISSFWLF